MRGRSVLCIAAAALCALSVACSAGSEPRVTEEIGTGTETAAGTEEQSPVPDGAEFTVIRSGKERRESLSRAVRLRDMAVAVRTGIEVKYADAADDGAAEIAAAADFLSGGNEYSAAEGSFSRLCAPLLMKGALRAAEEFAGAYGCEFLNPSLKTENGTFFITGPTVPVSLSDAACIAVNLETARRFSVRVPDRATLAGRSGWDALTASAAPVPEGVGIYRYGVTDRSVGTAVLRSAGLTVTERRAGGIPAVVSHPGDAALASIGRAASLFGDGSVTFRPEKTMPQNEREVAVRGAFSDPGVLYLFCKTGDIPALRDAGDDIGVIPYPGEASGADSVRGTAGAIMRGGDRATVKEALRALVELSEKYVLAETVDAFLSGRTRYDADSRDALLFILSSVRYETALTLAGEGGEELSDMLSAAAAGDADALVGWDLKAALLYPQFEKIFGG